jgi:Reverse transcriptase (RNA-dependent DNA polymerase)
MGDIKLGEPFGLETGLIAKINWSLALKRIQHDVRTDFVYAPHLNFIYNKSGEMLIDNLKAELKAGTYSPGLPLTIEVPKSYRIGVAAQIKRLGPNFSRPGSILLPRDRLLYQAMADQAAAIIRDKTDDSRSFSHKLDPADGPSMFLPTRTCWNGLQNALKSHSTDENLLYVVKVDVANFFGSINLHELINTLNDSGFPKPLYSRLEVLLTSFTGDRSSRGILQGIYPSDLFGNFYLVPIDRVLEEHEVPSARYVDDIYIFVKNMKAAERLIRELIPALRTYDLTLNEAKSKILLKSSLITEEPDLEALFADAVEEISSQLDDDDFDADYGFQSEWDDEDNVDDDNEDDESDLELKATKLLFDSIGEYPGHEENIERFCLPLFAKAESDYAVQHVLDVFKKRPAMSQIFSAYLASFIGVPSVKDFLHELLNDNSLVDWQKMWVLAALSQMPEALDKYVKTAMSILKDGAHHDALRAVAAAFVGRFGDHSRRKALAAYYSSVSAYVQAAIYFSSKNWPSVERNNAKATWGSQSPLNALLTAAFAKK